MIDLDKAAQAAEALGWNARKGPDKQIITVVKNSHVLIFFEDGGISVNATWPSITDIAPLIAAWAALAAGGTDGRS